MLLGLRGSEVLLLISLKRTHLEQDSKFKCWNGLQQKLGNKNLEVIAVLENLKLPFKVDKTIPIHKFDAEKIEVDFNKTYVMVCQRGLNSYKATERLKKKYPDLKVLNLTGGVSSYK